MTKLFSVLMLLFFVGSAQAHTIIGEPKDPDPCLNLAIPYDLCLQTIGKEWLERQRKNAPPSLEERIRKLEKIINDIQRTR